MNYFMEERYDIVDKDDNILQKGLLKEELHINDDITRVVTIYVCDSQWRYHIAQRSPNRKIDPLSLGSSAHGKVNSGENYETAARRETHEELGIEEVSLEELAHFYYSFNTAVWIRQHWKKLYIWKCEELWEIDTNEIYSMKSFDNLEQLLEFYEANSEKFSGAVAFDIPYIKTFISK